MSSFCVFGIKKSDCVAEARKLIPWSVAQTHAIHSMYADLLAEHLYREMPRAKQIAPAFDTPQFACEWIDIAKRSGQAKSMRVIVRGPKVDKNGVAIVRKGKQVIEWIEYKPSFAGQRVQP